MLSLVLFFIFWMIFILFSGRYFFICFFFFLLSSSVNFCSYGFLSCFCFSFFYFIRFILLPLTSDLFLWHSSTLYTGCCNIHHFAFCFFLFVFFLFLYFLLTLYLSIFMKFVANEYWYVYTRTLWRWQLVCRALNVANSCCCSVLRWHDCTNPRCRHNR